MVSARGNEKDIIINLTQKEKDVEIEIKIDSYIARRKNKRIITEADLHWPEIVEEISMDLLGYVEPALRNRLFPEKHKKIMRFDRNLLIVFGLIFLIYAFIDFSSVLNVVIMMVVIFGGTYLYNYFKK